MWHRFFFQTQTLQWSIGWSLTMSSLLGMTQTCTGSGLSDGPTIPLDGLTLNMLHRDCEHPGVGVRMNL